jgi:hypothetical protein
MAEVKAKFGANDDELQAALKRTQRSLNSVGGELRKGINTLGKWGIAAVGAAKVAGTAMYVQSSRIIDSQAKLSRALNTSRDSFIALSLAAADMGIDDLEGSLARLNRRLGAAEFGAGPAAVTVKRLNLELKDLAQLPVDERLAVIIDRMREMNLSNQEAARHLQNLGFEQANAVQMFMEGGDAIRAYQDQVKALGLSMTEVQTARVEAANDAFSRGVTVVQGLAQQITTNVAPIVQALAERFEAAAVEAGGVGSMAEQGFQKAVKAAGVLADILHGVRVALKTVQLGFQAVGSAAAYVGLEIAKGWSLLLSDISDRVASLIEMVNRIPGVNIPTEGLERFSGMLYATALEFEDMQAVAVNAARDVASELHELAMQEMPSQALSRFVEEVTEKANQAAAAVIEARQSMTGGEAGGMSEEERKALEDRLEAVKQAMLSEQEVMAQKYAQDHETLVAALENELTTREEFEALMLARAQEYQAALSEIEQKAADQRAKIAEDERRVKSDAMRKAFGDLSTLMNSGSRKLFEIGKAAATASALIDARAAIVGAYKVGARIGGPPLGIAYGAAAGAAQFSQIAAIQRQTFNSKGGGGASITESVNAQSVPVGGQSRSVSIDLGITGGSDRDRAVAGSVIAQLNDEIARGGRIAGLSLR